MSEHFSNLELAKYDLVHQFRGGAVALAARAGMNAGTLSNKVNPSVETHHLTVDEGVRLQNIAGDFRLLHAEAEALGHVAIRVADWQGVSDTELLDALLLYHQELGETAAALRSALDSGRITRAHCDTVRREAFEDMRALCELLARLEGLVRD